jgi:hypothetical protein
MLSEPFVYRKDSAIAADSVGEADDAAKPKLF